MDKTIIERVVELKNRLNKFNEDIKTNLTNKGIDSTNIDLSNIESNMDDLVKKVGSAQAGDCLPGKTFINNTGELITGTLDINTDNILKNIRIGDRVGTYRGRNNGRVFYQEHRTDDMYLAGVRRIRYNNDIWLVATDKGMYYSDDNMDSWKDIDINIPGTQNPVISNMVYENGKWVAVVGVYSKPGLVFHSLNGKEWAISSSELKPYTTIIDGVISFGNGVWLLCCFDGIYKSTDNAISWTKINTGYNGTCSSCIYAKGIWVANYGSTIYYSTDDANTWTKLPLTSINGFSYDNGIFHIKHYSSGYKIKTSTDLITWDTKTYTEIPYFVDGLWITRAGLYSTDLINWTDYFANNTKAKISGEWSKYNGMYFIGATHYIENFGDMPKPIIGKFKIDRLYHANNKFVAYYSYYSSYKTKDEQFLFYSEP